MEEIDSETKFVWKFILKIVLTPWMLILILFGKKKFKELFEPFRLLFEFIFQAKFVISIIIINIIIFAASLFLSDSLMTNLLMYPGDLFSSHAYTIITAGFLHADIWHLLWNMLALFIFGRVIERKLGSKKTALIYFGAMIISGIFSQLIDVLITGSTIPSLGASGAIMGLVSAAIILDPFYFTYELLIPLPIMAAGWLAMYSDITGIINPTDDGISHFAHLGGYLSIAIILWLFGAEEKEKLKKGFIINIISLIVIGGLYIFILK